MNATVRICGLFVVGLLPFLSACGAGSSTTSSVKLLPFSSAVPADQAGLALRDRCFTPKVFKHALNAIFFGINDKGVISGSYETGNNQWRGFVIYPPYRQIRWISNPGMVVTAIAENGRTKIGYIMNPTQLSGIWGFVIINGLLTLMRDPNEGKGQVAVTEFLGLNDKGDVVGYYVNHIGVNVPIIVDIDRAKFINLKPPGNRGAVATGVNDERNVVGWMTGRSGTNGFLFASGSYTELSDPSSVDTYPNAINGRNDVVGYYRDATGNLHGFILTDPLENGTWQSVDERNAAGTVLTGINDHGDFDGYYFDQAGNTKPFLCS